METIGSPLLWGIFSLTVVAMIGIDLFAMGEGKQRVTFKQSAIWSVIWVLVALAFGGWMNWYLHVNATPEIAHEKSLEFLTGYLIERSLAIDNVFIWLLLFAYFHVPLELQRRVLVYGVVGAIVMRTAMIFGGAWLITNFHWVLYVFGGFLLLTGIRMYRDADEKPDLDKNGFLLWLRRHMNITSEFDEERFFVWKDGVRYATPLFVALIVVEASDLIFAVDSIPAIFAITTDPFIVLTSNVFAILGLRAMYFLLADVADRFALLKYGLAAVLIFIGFKMLLMDVYKIPVGVSLIVVFAILGISVLLSLRLDAKKKARALVTSP